MSPGPAMHLGCPNEGELSAFADGRLPETASSAIAEHLAQCRPCEETIRRMTAESSLVHMLRLAGSASVQLEPECVRMQAAVREIPRRAGHLPDDLSQESTDSSRLSTNAPQVKPRPGNDLTTVSRDALPAKIGRYRIQSILGEGAYGRVYLAVDPDLDRQVALKVPKFTSQFGGKAGGPLVEALLREARTAAKLKHPGIVTIYEAGRDDQAGCYVAMEYVEGKSLKQVMSAGNMPHEQAAKYIAQAAEAVHYAHKQGLVHRDLKPANLLIDGEGNLKVADFGLALFEEEQRKRPGEFAGTLAYCSPEQVRGEVPYLDARTDIWSLGVIFYELLTGRRPFGGPNVADEILHRPPKPVRQLNDEISSGLEGIVLTCLRQAATDRYAAALDLSNAIKDALKKDSKTAPKQNYVLGAIVLAGVLLAVVAVSAGTLGLLREQPRIAAPELVAWHPRDTDDRFGYDSRLQCFRFDAWGHALFSVTTSKQAAGKVHVDYSVKRWEGLGGVFWGLHRQADGDFRCYAVRMGRYDADQQFQVEICEYLIGKIGGGRQGVRSEKILHDFVPPAVPIGVRTSLDVEFSPTEVTQIWLDGVPMLGDPFPLPARLAPVNQPTASGFCGEFGEIVIYDYRLN